MAIFAHPPIVVHNGSCVCMCFENGERTVSLSMDDSCGRMTELRRGTIELLSNLHRDPLTIDVFRDLCHEDDPTGEFLVVPATLENFERAMRWLRRTNWGFVTSSQEPRA
jgi:hypothetical protein